MKRLLKILLVEDHDSVSLGVQYSLQRQKEILCEVTTATTADIAFSYTNREQYDIILLDLVLKNEPINSKLSGGDDLLRELNKRLIKPKVIVLSKIDSLEMLDYIINVLDADGYILKSRTSLNEIIPAIKSVINGNSFYSNSVKKILKYNESLLEIDYTDRMILKYLSLGLKQSNIVSSLREKGISITLSAIEKRIKKLKIRFVAQTTAQLTAIATKEGII